MSTDHSSTWWSWRCLRPLSSSSGAPLRSSRAPVAAPGPVGRGQHHALGSRRRQVRSTPVPARGKEGTPRISTEGGSGRFSQSAVSSQWFCWALLDREGRYCMLLHAIACCSSVSIRFPPPSEVRGRPGAPPLRGHRCGAPRGHAATTLWPGHGAWGGWAVQEPRVV